MIIDGTMNLVLDIQFCIWKKEKFPVKNGSISSTTTNPCPKILESINSHSYKNTLNHMQAILLRKINYPKPFTLA